jgi:hypothetical protein
MEVVFVVDCENRINADACLKAHTLLASKIVI